MLVAIRSMDAKRVPTMMKWELIPHWAKDDKLQYSTRNARSEEFCSMPAFREAWKRVQHCLVITNGFYELRSSTQTVSKSSHLPSPWRTIRKWSWPACGPTWNSPTRGEEILTCTS
jgi:putative SOS response-associated peptidase YedK